MPLWHCLGRGHLSGTACKVKRRRSVKKLKDQDEEKTSVEAGATEARKLHALPSSSDES